MASDPRGDLSLKVATLLVPEIRDYVRINAEIVNLLNAGVSQIRLEGADGQRLLAAGLVGPWQATIEILGPTGPEVAANLAAPGVRIVCRASTRDGAGRGLLAGLILILGDAADGLGYAQAGGSLVVQGNAGHRAGLGQTGGTLAVLGATGRLAGERQAGGRFFLGAGGAGPHLGRASSGGRRIHWEEPLEPSDQPVWDELIGLAHPWLESTALARPA